MPSTVRLYEVVYIVAPDVTEEQVQAIIDKYANLITNQGGTVIKSEIWERRRLAYEIKGFQEGVYVVVHFRGLPTVEAELRRVFRISEDTLRSVIIRPEDESALNTPPPESQQRYYQQEPTRAPVAASQDDVDTVPVVAVAEEPAVEAPTADEPTVEEPALSEPTVEETVTA
jgi:small subunit ribosomal protein S6